MSSAEQRKVVQRLCPSCDAEPPLDREDPNCPSCGAKLIEVRRRSPDLAGTVLDGRFEIRDLLGEGGMGSVYRAWQRSIGREVAIKLIDARHSNDPMSVRRFLREARLASQLSQPNTVSVFDFGQAADGRLFIAMELVRGKTLADILDRDGPFSVQRAAWIGVQLCDALDAAHRLQIVHRDLKPENVVVLDDPPGRDLLKILDFGLAKSLTENESRATDTGLVVGTPRYMAPEIVMGEKPTPGSDLYAVGVILGELTTGKVLWNETSFPALAGAKLGMSPVANEIPMQLRGLIMRLLDPEVRRRPSAASEVREKLRAVMAGGNRDIPATQPPVVGLAGDPAAVGVPAQTVALRTPSPAPSSGIDVPLASLSEVMRDHGGRLPSSPPGATATASPSIGGGIAELRGISDVGASPLELEPRQPARATGGGGGGTAMSSPTTATSQIAHAPARGGNGLLYALLAAAIGIGVVIVVTSVGSSKPKPRPAPTTQPAPANDPGPEPAAPPTTQPAAVDPKPPAADPAPATVMLHVTSTPSGLPITLDGVAAGTTPADLAVPRGDREVVVEVTHKGKALRQSVKPDQDRTVELGGRDKPGGAGKPDLPF